MRAPMPIIRRVAEKRLSADTASRASSARPSDSFRCAPSASVHRPRTAAPSNQCRPAWPSVAAWAARRIRWLGTSQPRSRGEWPPSATTIANGDGPFITRASHSGEISAGSMRCQMPSSSSSVREAWVSAISRPSNAASASACRDCGSTSATDRPLSASDLAKHRPAGPAPITATSTCIGLLRMA